MRDFKGNELVGGYFKFIGPNKVYLTLNFKLEKEKLSNVKLNVFAIDKNSNLVAIKYPDITVRKSRTGYTYLIKGDIEISKYSVEDILIVYIIENKANIIGSSDDYATKSNLNRCLAYKNDFIVAEKMEIASDNEPSSNEGNIKENKEDVISKENEVENLDIPKDIELVTFNYDVSDVNLDKLNEFERSGKKLFIESLLSTVEKRKLQKQYNIRDTAYISLDSQTIEFNKIPIEELKKSDNISSMFLLEIVKKLNLNLARDYIAVGQGRDIMGSLSILVLGFPSYEKPMKIEDIPENLKKKFDYLNLFGGECLTYKYTFN